MKKLISIILLVAIMFVTGCGNTPAESSATQFMQLFKEQNFYEMVSMSDIELEYLVYEHSGTFIKEYAVKSVSEPVEVKHTIKLSSATSYSYENMKRVNAEQYPDYIVITDTDTEYVIESPTPNILQYEISFDVKYSDITNTTRNATVTLIMTQKDPRHQNEFIVSEMRGL